MQCGIEEQAAKLGVTVDTQGPTKFDPTLQKPILDSVVASEPDAILIAPTDVAAMQGPLAAAAGAGIKIVLVDTTTEDPSFAVSQVASDNVGGGAAAFDAIKGWSPAAARSWSISVDPGVSTTDARVEGFQTAVADDGTFTDLGVQYSHNDPATAASLVTSALQKDPDIVGIFATNLFAAQGAATGIEQAGKKDAVKIVGFDAGPDQIQALKDGVVQALVAQQPGTIGVDGLNQAVLALNGETATPKIQTGFSIITRKTSRPPRTPTRPSADLTFVAVPAVAQSPCAGGPRDRRRTVRSGPGHPARVTIRSTAYERLSPGSRTSSRPRARASARPSIVAVVPGSIPSA